MEAAIRAILSDLEIELRALYGPRLVRLVLFGSQARGEADEGSDIDVLVVLVGPVDAWEEIERTGRIVSDLSLDHTVVISCVFIAEDRYRLEESPLLLNVRREGVLI
ncbi:MAG: nucleotidyltransferase domain-containing protein [Actinobacteria bacterium]|nr:nucleotidyltransferase domain-containing protein [Actinomycetota bacterium]